MRRVLALVVVLVSLHPTPATGQGAGGLVAGGGAIVANALASCETDLHTLNQIAGWQARWPVALGSLPVRTAEDREAAIRLWSGADEALTEDVRALREGIREGRTAPRPVVRRVLAQVDALLATAPDAAGDDDLTDVPLHAPASRSDDPAFGRRWRRLVREEIVPAIRRYRRFLVDTYLPAARDTPGLAALPDGTSCFLDAVEGWTTLRLSGEEIERRGRAYLESLEGELLALIGDGEPLPAVLDRLWAGGLEDGFETGEEVVAHARAAIARAEAAAPAWFATPGETPVEVAPVPPFMEDEAPAGFYRMPAADGAPGRYFVNTSRPRERRLMSEVIAFHEAVPGHHTSFAVPAAMGNAFASGDFNSGFVEGWAIYAERLADEMGLYSSDLDRAGLVAKHMWAASRLVIEPGLHLHGWSRERALDFLLDHSALSRDEAALEIDRYLAIPGQSLAYVLGYLELAGMREAAARELGEAFDVGRFHDIVLGSGVRPLPAVGRDVEAWVERGGGPDRSPSR